MALAEVTTEIGTLLQVLEIVSIIGGGGVIAYRVGKTTQRVEQTLREQTTILEGQQAEVEDLKHEIRQVGKVLTQLAVQQSRLDRLEADVRELKHGQGYVMPNPDRRRDR